MVGLRSEKVERVANYIPEQLVEGNPEANTLVVSWGGTYGSVFEAVKELNLNGQKCAHVHVQYINPMPKNMEEILRSFDNIVVCELNEGQMKSLINSKYSIAAKGYNKVQGKPFKVRELVQMLSTHL
jgi:2-oxoglutarate ferredoxin oxidoreductase subunit alpha